MDFIEPVKFIEGLANGGGPQLKDLVVFGVEAMKYFYWFLGTHIATIAIYKQ